MRTHWRKVFWIIFTWQYMSIELAGSYQFCGRELASVLSTVCANTGYNTPSLSPEPSSGGHSIKSRRARAREIQRRKRGIVDECCRAGCSWSTLEQYCRPAESTTHYPEKLPMRKRSDLSKTWKMIESVSEDSSQGHYEQPFESNSHPSKMNLEENENHQSREGFEKRLDSNKVFTTFVSLDNNSRFKTQSEMSNAISIFLGETDQATNTVSGSGKSERASLLKFIGQQEKPNIRTSENHDANLRMLQVGTVYPYFMSRKIFSPVAESMRTPTPKVSVS